MSKSAVRISKLALRAVWLAYALALFTATHIPIPPQAAALVDGWDKVIHFSAFFGLGLLTAAVFVRPAPLGLPAPQLIVGLWCYSALDEFLQGFVGRTPDFFDWTCDAAGTGCAVMLVHLAVRTLSQTREISESAEPVPVTFVEGR